VAVLLICERDTYSLGDELIIWFSSLFLLYSGCPFRLGRKLPFLVGKIILFLDRDETWFSLLVPGAGGGGLFFFSGGYVKSEKDSFFFFFPFRK